MKQKINDFVDLFPDFHSLGQTEQIVLLVYFHAVLEGRESVNSKELRHLFELADVPVPEHLARLLIYLSTKARKLIRNDGEFRLRREIRKEIEQALKVSKPAAASPQETVETGFDFGVVGFPEKKIAVLMSEVRTCYQHACWNATGLLTRIIIERTLDTVDQAVKNKTGLRDKINACRNVQTLSKSLREAMDGLQGAKIIGDIAAHHSSILLDKADVDLVLPAFRVLIKEIYKE